MNGNADCMGQAGEQEAQQTIRSAITGGILLYLCESCLSVFLVGT